MIRRSIALVSPAVEALSQIDGWPAETRGRRSPARRRGSRRPRAARARLSLGLGDEAGDRAGNARRGRGGDRRPGRAGGAARARRCAICSRTRRACRSKARSRSRGRGSGGSTRTRASRCSPRRSARPPRCRSREYLRRCRSRPARDSAELRGSPAAGLDGTLDDLLALAGELQAPTLVAPETLAEATSVQFPGLGGVLPGLSGAWSRTTGASASSCATRRQPHWTGRAQLASHLRPLRRQRHVLLGRPRRRPSSCVSDRSRVRPWALEAWPRLSDDVLIFR